jgi:class 3 adenylate cyclase
MDISRVAISGIIDETGAVEPPDIHYARSGDLAIAYQAIGEGPLDLVFCPFNLNLFYVWEIPQFADLLRRLAAFSRLILFDHRGTGLSDRPRDLPTLEARMDDIRAAMDAVGSEQAALLGVLEGGHLTTLFTATYPERTSALILFNPSARDVQAPDYPWGLSTEQWRARLKEIREGWGSRELSDRFAAWMFPSLARDEDFLERLLAYTRLWASPGAAHDYFRMAMETDIREALKAVRVPTLVLYREPFREQSLDVARRIPESKAVMVPGKDAGIAPGSEPTQEIERFLLHSDLEAEPERVLSTILFTDIVGSTERATELGDSEWRTLLEQHHALVRRQLARFRGREVDTAGDGFFASFDGPARAIRCACEIVQSMPEFGLEVRAGLHTGECELVDGKVAGVAVHTGARVASQAQPGEVVVSRTVKDLVAGSGIAFEDRGTHGLKGIPGEWQLFAVKAT